MTTYELRPAWFQSQKSFGGRARVVDLDYICVLYSYSTPVCAVLDGKFCRLWDGWSATTARHVNAFRNLCAFGLVSKKDWLEMPVVKLDFIR